MWPFGIPPYSGFEDEKFWEKFRKDMTSLNHLTEEEYKKQKRAYRRHQRQWTEGSYEHEWAKRKEAELDEKWRQQQELNANHE